MPSKEEYIGGTEEWRETANGTNAQIIAGRAAVLGLSHYVTGFSISASAAPTAGVTAYIESDGGAVEERAIVLPNALTPPLIYEFKRPLQIDEGRDVALRVPALGIGVVARCEILGFTRAADRLKAP